MDLVQEDRRVTVRQVAQKCSMSLDSAWKIMKTDKHLEKLAPKVVPHLLSDDQKQFRKTISERNLELIRGEESLIDRIVTTDESWIFSYDPRTKQADMEWTPPEDPRPVKVRRSRSQSRTRLTVFFDSKGIVYTEFKDEGTVTSEIYIQTLRKFREAMRRKCQDTWNNQSFLLLQDNAPAHVSNMALDYFHRVKMTLLSHPPYSPDLAPCDFWLFPMLKKQIRGHRFQSLDDLKTTVVRTLRATPQEQFQRAMG